METKHTALWPGYEITDDGRVFSTSNWRGYGKRELKQTLNDDGYPSVRLKMVDGQRKHVPVYKLIAAVFLSSRPSMNHEIRHLDGNKANNHFSNLAWGTRQENANDREKHGHTYRGEKHHSAKLTREDVVSIRFLLAQGRKPPVLAQQFGVTKENIYAIRNYKTWRVL